MFRPCMKCRGNKIKVHLLNKATNFWMHPFLWPLQLLFSDLMFDKAPGPCHG